MVQQDDGTGQHPPPCPHHSGHAACMAALPERLFLSHSHQPQQDSPSLLCTHPGLHASQQCHREEQKEQGCRQCRSISPRQDTSGHALLLLGSLFGFLQAPHVPSHPQLNDGAANTQTAFTGGSKALQPLAACTGVLLPQTHLPQLGLPGKVQNQPWQHIEPCTVWITNHLPDPQAFLPLVELQSEMLTAWAFHQGAG